MSTSTLLWLQLGTPFMYFGMWFALFLVSWFFSTRTSSRNNNNNNNKNNNSENNSSIRLSLMNRLLDHNHNAGAAADDDVGNDNDGDDDDDKYDLLDQQQNEDGGAGVDNSRQHSNKTQLKQLCRRFRFLRALELLMLFSYEILTEQALQLVNCIHVGECGRVLAEYPDLSCPHSSSYLPLLIVAILILVYSVAFPAALFWFLRKNNVHVHNSDAGAEWAAKESKSETIVMEAKFGVFYGQFKPQFWWWEIQVSFLFFSFFFKKKKK